MNNNQGSSLVFDASVVVPNDIAIGIDLDIDSQLLASGDVTFIWQRSIDGEVWEDVSEESFYSISSADENSYLRVFSHQLDNSDNSYVAPVRLLGNVDYIEWEKYTQVLLGEDESDYFGSSLELSYLGDRLVVGSPGSDGGRYGRKGGGRADVFELSIGNWIHAGDTIASSFPDNSPSDSVGLYVSISDDGGLIAVGAPGYNYGSGSNNNEGQVRFFLWINLPKLGRISWESVITLILVYVHFLAMVIRL